MALCRWLYNRLLSELNLAKEKGIKLTRGDTQALVELVEKLKFSLLHRLMVADLGVAGDRR